MSLRIAVSIAALTLVAASCTSSAEAENDGPELGATSLFSADENAIARLIENLFRAINEEEEYAVYAMFTPHDTCRPADIAEERTARRSSSIGDNSLGCTSIPPLAPP